MASGSAVQTAGAKMSVDSFKQKLEDAFLAFKKDCKPTDQLTENEWWDEFVEWLGD